MMTMADFYHRFFGAPGAAKPPGDELTREQLLARNSELQERLRVRRRLLETYRRELALALGVSYEEGLPLAEEDSQILARALWEIVRPPCEGPQARLESERSFLTTLADLGARQFAVVMLERALQLQSGLEKTLGAHDVQLEHYLRGADPSSEGLAPRAEEA